MPICCSRNILLFYFIIINVENSCAVFLTMVIQNYFMDRQFKTTALLINLMNHCLRQVTPPPPKKKKNLTNPKLLIGKPFSYRISITKICVLHKLKNSKIWMLNYKLVISRVPIFQREFLKPEHIKLSRLPEF